MFASSLVSRNCHDCLAAVLLLWAALHGSQRVDAVTPSTTTTTTIAFGSCHKNKKSAIPSIWESIVRHDDDAPLDAFVWTGDAMYPSYYDATTGKKRYGPASPLEIAQGFDEMKTNTTIGYTRLLEKQIPIYGTWDDHDYGGNDLGKHMPNRSERQQVFWEFLGYQPHTHDGVYHSIDIARRKENVDAAAAAADNTNNKINLILLDTRSFRDDHCIPSVAHQHALGNVIACMTRWLTAGLDLWKYAKWWGKEGCEQSGILGDDQWAWLETQLLTSTADLNIIVSSVQIWTTNPAMESWGHFPKEQERLWTLLERHYARGGSKGPVIFWSGDVHHGEVSGQPGFLEVTSSGMTHHCGQPTIYGRLCRPLLENFPDHRFRKDTFYIGLNYGILRVDWQTRIASVEVKTSKGDTVLQVEQPLDIGDFHLPSYDRIPRTWNGHLRPWFARGLTLLMIILLTRVLLLQPRSR